MYGRPGRPAAALPEAGGWFRAQYAGDMVDGKGLLLLLLLLLLEVVGGGGRGAP